MKRGIILSAIIALAIAGVAAAAYFIFAPFNPVVVGDTVSSGSIDNDSDIDLDDPEFADINEDTIWTPHNSVIVNGVDEALVGTWVLKSQNVVGILNPFAGHTLSISPAGQYILNYNSETADRAPNCSVGGVGAGSLTTSLGVDLDRVKDQGDPDEVDAATYSEMNVVPNDAFSPHVVCEGADVDVTSNAASVPLGVGRASVGASGPYVRYSYTLDPDWNVLTMTFSSPSVVYNYNRVN